MFEVNKTTKDVENILDYTEWQDLILGIKVRKSDEIS